MLAVSFSSILADNQNHQIKNKILKMVCGCMHTPQLTAFLQRISNCNTKGLLKKSTTAQSSKNQGRIFFQPTTNHSHCVFAFSFFLLMARDDIVDTLISRNRIIILQKIVQIASLVQQQIKFQFSLPSSSLPS